MKNKETLPIATLEMTNCLQCPHHEILPDPDPDDWFCDDDVKVFCHKAEKDITVACRPYNVEEESVVPDWCPLIKLNNQENEKST